MAMGGKFACLPAGKALVHCVCLHVGVGVCVCAGVSLCTKTIK